MNLKTPPATAPGGSRASSSTPARHRVVALAIPQTVAFDLSIAAQVFGHPEVADRYSFQVCAPQPGPVPTSTGFAITVEAGLDLLQHADTLIVPGFHGDEPLPGVVIDALRQAAGRGARIASICIGVFALAAAGLLDGRPATTHWQEADRLQRLFPRVRVRPDVLYEDTGQMLTSAGLSAGIDLCIHMVRNDFGEEAARAVARRMVVAVHRTGGQLQYARRPLPTDGGLGPTREWAIEQMYQPLTLQRLAVHAGVPARTFSRQFLEETGDSPMRWLTTQRVREVCRLLEATELTIEDIAAHTGLGSAATLRTHFERVMFTTPTKYRSAHRAHQAEAGG